MENKPIIFLDMDGVLCDWVGPGLKALGHEGLEIEKGNPNVEKWKEINISKNEFWRRIDAAGPDFWVNLPIYPWAHALVEMCEKYGDVFILSSPSRNPNCHAGKMTWVNNHLPRLADKVILTGHKYLCAAPGRFLIDDGAHNTKPFTSYGGVGILFPQLWNDLYYLCPVEKVGFIQRTLEYEINNTEN